MVDSETIPREKKGCLGPTEYIILVVVFLLLAAFAIPDFMKMFPKNKCGDKRPNIGEAKTNLCAIFNAQTSHRDDHKVFAKSPNLFDKLEWHPEWPSLYSFYCGEDVIPCDKSKCSFPTPSLGPAWPFPVKPMASDTAFVCVAVGNIDNDETFDVWTVNENMEFRNVINDVNQ